MVYSGDGIPEKESIAAHRHLASLLSNNPKQEYLEMCGFVRAWMSLSIVIYNTLLLHGAKDKYMYIQKMPILEDGAVMALMAPWRDKPPRGSGDGG